MALIHLRGMINQCRYTHQFLKFYTADTTTWISRQFSVTCLGRHLNGELPSRKDQPLNYLQKGNLSTGSVCLKNVKVDILSTALNGVDFEELAEQVRNERKAIKDTTKDVHLVKIVKEAVSIKCDEMLANLGPEDEKKLKVIKLEHSFLFSEGYLVPTSEEMQSENWLEALKLPSKSQRLKYYSFLSKRRHIKESAKLKKAVKKELPEDLEKEYRNDMIVYEHGRIFMRIYDTTMRRWLSYRLATSMQFGLPLVIDMDYISYMKSSEIRNTASQLHDLYSLNKNDEGLPFHLHFTNCQKDNPVLRQFQLNLHEEQGFLATVTEESYLDLFDKETLVYLSPNGRQAMREFDPSAVYIIGAYNDKASMKPISYARAKEYQIKCQRLPLDEYVKWNLGSKNLTLDQMMKIMTSVKNKQPWHEAFKAIPKRKLKDPLTDE